MIYLDDQGGSGNKELGIAPASLVHTLKPLLEARNLPLTVRTLHFGDVSLVGNGPEGRSVRVGVEIKTVSEFLTSIYTHRLAAHQLPGLLRSYEYIWILLEGRMRKGENGRLEISHPWLGWIEPKGASHDWRAVQSYLFSLTIIAGAHIALCEDRDGTADFIAALHHWWGKSWRAHKGLQAIDYQGDRFRGPQNDQLLISPGNTRRAFAALDGVGYHRSGKALAAFPTIEAAVQASLKEWQKVLGPVVGKTAYEALRSQS